jgi:hypothetical protein
MVLNFKMQIEDSAPMSIFQYCAHRFQKNKTFNSFILKQFPYQIEIIIMVKVVNYTSFSLLF